jgi:hypothetical protein
MDKKARFMEAVAEKVGRRKPMMKRKPGMAVMIAIGAPKKPPMEDEMEDKMEDKMESDGKVDHSKMSKAEHIAYLQEKIASLKAELALLEDEDEMEDENEMEKDESEYEDEDED